VEHTSEVRLSLSHLLSIIVDAETGVRGYLLAGEGTFLEPYQRSQAAWPAELAHLRTLTADNPEQQRRLGRVQQLIGERFEILAKMRSGYDAGERGEPLIALVREGKPRMDALRAIIAELEGEEARLDTIRQREVVLRWQLALFALGGIFLACLISLVVIWRLRHRAEGSRRAAEERFRLMVESVNDYAIITLDREGRVTTWNRGAQLIKGWSSDEILGEHFSRFYPAEDVRAGKCERELEIVAREGGFEEEGWRVRKDGSRFWANVVINAVEDEDGGLVGYTKVTRDLSERKLAAETLAREYQRRIDAEAESRFAQMFIGILGHDLRNPLNAIAMATRLLRKKLGGGDPRDIDRISTSTRRMSNMVDQLLDLTRSRLSGGIPIDKRPTDLAAIAVGAIEELRLAHEGRMIRWEAYGEVRCAFDPDRMSQVVSNLVGNALQHGTPGTPVTVRLVSNRDEAELSVHNHGPPIPPELLPHIFEPYRRTTARDERSRGLGLGLFITQQVVRAHGGHIEVHSTADQGTTFTVKLPCSVTTSVASPPEAL
jgi:PAS domain S-box-containing protein